MPDPAPEDLGEIIIRGQRVSFPFGLSGNVGGGGPVLPGGSGDDELDPEEPLDPPQSCQDISSLTDEQKEAYLIQYLAQRIAALIRAQPQQNREWGSAINRDYGGNYRFTPLTPAIDHRANIDYSGMPQVNGYPDYALIVGLLHSHPRINLDSNGSGLEVDYWDASDPTRLLRPWSGDWSAYSGLQTSMGSTPNAANLMMFILGYTQNAGGGGQLTLHSYSASDRPAGGGDSPTSNPTIPELEPPCNE